MTDDEWNRLRRLPFCCDCTRATIEAGLCATEVLRAALVEACDLAGDDGDYREKWDRIAELRAVAGGWA